MRNITITIISLIIINLITGCNFKKNNNNDKISVTVSIEPQRFFLEQIAGDKINVKTLLPNGAKPETYDLTPSQLMDLSKSHAYFMMGTLAFERTWADTYTSDHPHTNIFIMSEGIKPIITDHFHCNDNIETEEHKFIEPHTWMSIKNAKYIAENTLKGMIAIDPDNKELYQCNYDSLMSRIQNLDNKIANLMENADTAFMIYHPALSYFARDYGLTQISIESDGKEPSPAQLKSIIEESSSMGVNVIFIQPEFDPRNAQIVSNETGAEIVQFNPLSYDWEKEISKVAEALTIKN